MACPHRVWSRGPASSRPLAIACSNAPIHLVAVGKAAPAMAVALMAQPGLRVTTALAIGTHPAAHMPASLDFMPAGHPYPDARSRAAAVAAFERASNTGPDEHLVLLMSGGASALMCDAADGLPFEDKLAATRAFMLAGADIHQLNALRKHLSRVKGGWLAAACRGITTTLALSDVVGDDLSVIGSGPGLPDPSTWQDVSAALTTLGAWHCDAGDRKGSPRGRARGPVTRHSQSRGPSPGTSRRLCRRPRSRCRIRGSDASRGPRIHRTGDRRARDWRGETGRARMAVASACPGAIGRRPGVCDFLGRDDRSGDR